MDRLFVIKEILDKKILTGEAAEVLGLSIRQVRRLVKRFKEDGINGIKSRNKGGNRVIVKSLKDQIMKLVSEKYSDFGPTLACEKLVEEGFKVSKETLRKWMIEQGFRKCKKRRSLKVCQSRERRERFGELVQIDGSYHDWFLGKRPKCCLLVFIDDATGKLIDLRFEERETTLGYMNLVYSHIKRYGKVVAYYSDRHSIFKTTRSEMIDGKHEDTQFKRALKTLNIELLCANSPQAKGRVERANKTLQDRLVKEMKILNISSIEEANNYLPTFIEQFNKRFSVQAKSLVDAHRPVFLEDEALQDILAIHDTRKLSKNLEFSFDSKLYQITTPNVKNRLQNKEVIIIQRYDETLRLKSNNLALDYKILEKAIKNNCVDSKDLNIAMDDIMTQYSPSSPIEAFA